MNKLKQALGSPVSGEERFWDREAEIALFIEHLDDGASLHLVAQRRIGKTSLMREVARRIEERYICLPVDLQTSHRAEDFIVELSAAMHPHKSLRTKISEVFGNVLGKAVGSVDELKIEEVSIRIREGLVQGNWEAKGSRLITELAASEKPVVIFMDEVPILVNRLLKGSDSSDYEMTPENRAAADAFLSWLRKQSIEHQGKIRFVVTGSIGLAPLLRQAGLSATINNLHPFDLEPWSPEIAIGCLDALANNYGVKFQERARERVTERLGSCIPHHVQMFFTHIYETCKKQEDMTCSPDNVDEVYERRMLSTRGHAELSHFEERLRIMIGDETLPYVLDLLTEAAVTGQLTPDAINILQADQGLVASEGNRITREILDILEHDGYLKRIADHYAFTSRLLQDWWKRRFGSLGFVKASDRAR